MFQRTRSVPWLSKPRRCLGLDRGPHLGQRSWRRVKQAGHMIAVDPGVGGKLGQQLSCSATCRDTHGRHRRRFQTPPHRQQACTRATSARGRWRLRSRPSAAAAARVSGQGRRGLPIPGPWSVPAKGQGLAIDRVARTDEHRGQIHSTRKGAQGDDHRRSGGILRVLEPP